MKVDLDQLRELMKALNEHELDELELHNGDESILVRRNGGKMVAAAPMAVQAVAAPLSSAPAAGAEAMVGELITSPFVGTFYMRPNPTSDPFIKTGDEFTKGQALCIVEAMKLMNEIEAEFDGVCLEVLIEDGKPVEYGDPLFRVEKR
ncbi:MAG: acetyl-CoA carboxylase biotin carboxyl carrier protein [Polyangiales bacterium]|jgi:acetyl-CoA carboxylase biotin carboxyl carrier protein